MTPNSDHPLNHLVRDEGGVRVERIEPNLDHLAWFTLRNLLGIPSAIADDRKAVSFFIGLMRGMPSRLNCYVNPWSIVTADRPIRDFLIAAVMEKRAWHNRLRSIFFGSTRTQKCFGLKGANRTKIDPALRQLEFHGVLVFAGKHIFPNQWPDPKTLSDRLTLVGSKFGRLTVVEDLPGQRHLCRCDCGNTKEADRCHLQSGRLKSCGCLAKEREAAIAARRRQRGR